MMTTAAKTYLTEFTRAMIAYVVLLPAAMILIERNPAAPWRFAAVLVPVIPLVFVLFAMLRFFGNIDELERKIHLEAVAGAAGVTAIVTFAYGMLENVGLPPLSMVYVLPFMVLAWTFGTVLAGRRYR